MRDEPALAAAEVGIAMAVALETGDAASLHDGVRDVGAMIALSRRTMRNIQRNICMALGLKAVFLVTTIAGLTGLWPTIMADTGAPAPRPGAAPESPEPSDAKFTSTGTSDSRDNEYIARSVFARSSVQVSVVAAALMMNGR